MVSWIGPQRVIGGAAGTTMGRRKGTKSATPGGRSEDPPDYYAKSDSDIAYLKRAHRRAQQNSLRQWLTRLLVVLVLVLAWHFWGPAVVRSILGEGRQTVQDLKGAGRKLQEGRDRRSGVGLDENP